jgi:hypothetical protein
MEHPAEPETEHWPPDAAARIPVTIFHKAVDDAARRATRRRLRVYLPFRSPRCACKAGCGGGKTTTATRRAPVPQSAADRRRRPQEAELTWPKALPPATPSVPISLHRGGCLEGTRSADPVDGRHATTWRASCFRALCASRDLHVSRHSCAYAHAQQDSSGCAVRGSVLHRMRRAAPGMRKAPTRGAFPLQLNSVHLVIRMTANPLDDRTRTDPSACG